MWAQHDAGRDRATRRFTVTLAALCLTAGALPLAGATRAAPLTATADAGGEPSEEHASGLRSATADTSEGGYSAAIRASRALLETLRREDGMPGLQVAVAHGGEIVWSDGFGLADLEAGEPVTALTKFRIGSLSKPLTATAALRLHGEGRLDLDAPVRRYVPSFPEKAHPVTARQLLGHLSGIRHYREEESQIRYEHYDDVVEALELFAGDTLLHVPGTEYGYSSYGYNLLSAVVQRASGRDFLEYMGRAVFGPLGMRHTTADHPDSIVAHRAENYGWGRRGLINAPYTDNSYKWASGGFLSTAEDLVRFSSGLLAGEVIGPALVETMFTSMVTSAGDTTGYAMGWRPRTDWDGRPVLRHGGSSVGGRAFLMLWPGERLAVALLANASVSPLFHEEAQTLAHFFLDHGGDTTRIGSDGTELAGTYRFTTLRDEKEVEGSLHLTGSRRHPGWMNWEGAASPVPLVIVDRHGSEMRLVGAGTHGFLNMWAEFREGGFSGRWNWLGRTSGIHGRRLESDSAVQARAARIRSGLRHGVRFTNAANSRMSLTERMAHYHVPGLTLALLEDHRIDWIGSFGEKRAGSGRDVTGETIFHGKSVSKPVAATLALRLVERGELELDVPLSRYLTSWEVPDNEFTRATPPTLRHLLSHTAGFTEWGVDSFEPSEPLPTLLETLRGETPEADTVTVDFEPGTAWRYSGGGYGVLQQLLVDVTGTPFPTLADSLVFTPLGMDHSFFPLRMPPELDPFAATGHDVDGQPLPGGHEILPMQAAGGIWTTATDLCRFVLAIFDAWAGREESFLSQRTVREMTTPIRGEWGLGVRVDSVDGRLRFSHTGSGDGFKAILVGYPEAGDGAIILTNGDGGGELRYEILRSIAEEYGWPGYEQAPYELVAVDPATLASMAGEYRWHSGIPQTVRLRGDMLETRFDDDGRFQVLHPIGERRFVTYSNEIYEFEIDEEGRVSTLVWRSPEGDESYRAERVGS